MAVEVTGFEMVQGPLDTGAEGGKPVLHEKENGKPDQELGAGEPIKFGSHGDESAKGEGNDVSDANAPKDAAEEWPAPKQIHSFYFVRCRPYDDPSIKSKIDLLDKELSKKNQARFQITEALKAKRSDRAELISQIKSLRGDNRQFQSIVDEKIKEIEPLQQALGKLRTANNSGRGGGLCSSEEELNDVIYSIQYRIQHESISLTEEKQLLREIKQLEGTRDKVIANAAMRAKLQDSIGQKEVIQDQVKIIGGDLDGVKKERQAIRNKIKQIDDELKTIDKDIQSLQEELAAVTQKREKAYESIQQLRKQRDEGNSYFYQSRTILNKARDLAAKKDVNALDDLSQTEVEKFMALWNKDKSFRNDYEKRILPSLDMRQLSRDGRMRNPDEMPLVEEPKPTETHIVSKAIPKLAKEEPKPSPQEAAPVQNESKSKGKDLKSKPDKKDSAETDEYEFEIPRKETPAKEPEIDPAKLKEIKREEEIAKAKQALERKRKLAEKAAAKAALRAQKEAEKKLKDREKKAKKKASGSAAALTPEDAPEEPPVVETTEEEKVSDNVVATAPVKEKVPKETGIRSRNRARAADSIPKVILKRKKSNNYWVWIACAALLVLLLLVLGYTYLF